MTETVDQRRPGRHVPWPASSRTPGGRRAATAGLTARHGLARSAAPVLTACTWPASRGPAAGGHQLRHGWDKARLAAPSSEEYRSPLGRRPYDLRHACLSTWLNGGVAQTQVAEWASHGVEILLRVYAKCLKRLGCWLPPAWSRASSKLTGGDRGTNASGVARRDARRPGAAARDHGGRRLACEGLAQGRFAGGRLMTEAWSCGGPGQVAGRGGCR